MTKKFNITNKKTGLRIPVIAEFQRYQDIYHNGYTIDEVEVWIINGQEMHFGINENIVISCLVRWGIIPRNKKTNVSRREWRTARMRNGEINIFGRVCGKKYSAIRRTNRR
jgi:hypothetical protein